ncbi:ACT domain-containing protein, partial [Clostridiaceae bacterium UIB06]|nr:ACT domain-containing protein [Clostridiaceae bacterium UIB06]
LEARVHPTMIPAIHPLANVNDSFNAIFIKGNAVGDLMLYGRGAGELPTGSAVVGDIISVLRNEETPAIQRQYTTKELVAPEDIKSQYYIRITVKDQPGVLGKITTIFGQNQVSILSFIQKPKKEDFVSLVLVTHDTFEGSINKSLEEIQKLDMIDKVKNVIRIENLG